MKFNRLLLAAALLGIAHAASAQALIDQAKAKEGNVTPGDSPGYPITLNSPGHYVLKGNLSVPAGTSGIVITSSNVTLDLNGFSVSGPVTCIQNTHTLAVSCSAPSNPDVAGIFASNNLRNTVIRNGTVRGFTGDGIHIGGSSLIENVSATSNAGTGARIGSHSASASRVSGSRFWANGVSGAYASGAIVERSSFSNNHRHGLSVEASTVIDSISQDNGGQGILGGGHNPAVGVEGRPTTLKGVMLFRNKEGAYLGYLFSVGGNFNGASAF